jgi:hypothetical protein
VTTGRDESGLSPVTALRNAAKLSDEAWQARGGIIVEGKRYINEYTLAYSKAHTSARQLPNAKPAAASADRIVGLDDVGGRHAEAIREKYGEVVAYFDDANFFDVDSLRWEKSGEKLVFDEVDIGSFIKGQEGAEVSRAWEALQKKHPDKDMAELGKLYAAHHDVKNGRMVFIDKLVHDHIRHAGGAKLARSGIYDRVAAVVDEQVVPVLAAAGGLVSTKLQGVATDAKAGLHDASIEDVSRAYLGVIDSGHSFGLSLLPGANTLGVLKSEVKSVALGKPGSSDLRADVAGAAYQDLVDIPIVWLLTYSNDAQAPTHAR